MFSTNAAKDYVNLPFRLKMTCLLLAGVNTAFFHLLAQRHIADWETGITPIAPRTAGAISLLLWVTIVGA